jgi:hypothetical protein
VRDHFVREISARAAPVLHDDLLAPELRQTRCQDARGCVGAAARRKSDDEVHRARRPSLRAREAGQHRQHGGTGGEVQKQSASEDHAVRPLGKSACEQRCATYRPWQQLESRGCAAAMRLRHHARGRKRDRSSRRD